MNARPTVSVIIPTHNRSKMIIRALRSVYNQKTPVDEVIVIDDGSDDDTADQIKSKFPQTDLIHQNQHGVSHARNRGIDAASGEWLAFLDSDDEWLCTKMSNQLESIKNHPTVRICHSDEIWVRKGLRVNQMKKHQKHGGWIFQYCLPRCVISPSSALVHYSVFEEFGDFDEKLPVCEDYELWLRITSALPVLYIPEALITKFGGHPDQLSHSRWGMDRYRIYSLEKLLAAEVLRPSQEKLALEEILLKLSICLGGAHRRDRNMAVQKYEKKTAFYENRLQSYS